MGDANRNIDFPATPVANAGVKYASQDNVPMKKKSDAKKRAPSKGRGGREMAATGRKA